MLVKTKIAGLAVGLMALSAPLVWADNPVQIASHRMVIGIMIMRTI